MDIILQVAGFIGDVYGTVGHAFICSKVALAEVYVRMPQRHQKNQKII